MAQSETEIANFALRNLGIGKEIASLTEDSPQARACNKFYEECRDAVLRDFAWPFATAFQDLALVSDEDEAYNDEWFYAYRYPSHCMMVRRLLSGNRNDAYNERVAYRLSRDDTGVLILCDEAEAQIEFTYKETEVVRFDPDFVLALSWRLASYIAPSITAGDPYGLAQKSLQMYSIELSKARANANNEQRPDQEVESEFIRARNG